LLKKEYLFFLVMVLAAAIVTGATIGFISNFHYIMNRSSATSQTEAVQQDTTASDPDEPKDVLQSDPAKSEDQGDRNPDSQVKKVTAVKPPTPTSEQGYLVLSQDEQEQVVNMLVSLGANQDGDYSEFIRNFQEKKSLPPTGSLDSLTLNAIILEATRQRAAQMVNG
jgi:hypothetical protein